MLEDAKSALLKSMPVAAVAWHCNGILRRNRHAKPASSETTYWVQDCSAQKSLDSILDTARFAAWSGCPFIQGVAVAAHHQSPALSDPTNFCQSGLASRRQCLAGIFGLGKRFVSLVCCVLVSCRQTLNSLNMIQKEQAHLASSLCGRFHPRSGFPYDVQLDANRR